MTLLPSVAVLCCLSLAAANWCQYGGFSVSGVRVSTGVVKRNGTQLFTGRFGDRIVASSIVSEDGSIVYLGSEASDGYVYALDAKTGAQLWKTGTRVGAVDGSPGASPPRSCIAMPLVFLHYCV